MRRVAAALIMAMVPNVPAQAAGKYEQVQVAEPYLELRTGPGRGYPVTQVVERGEWLELLKRRTDWFKVRTRSGKEGWTSRQEIEATLTATGEKKTLRDAASDGYWQRRIEAGFSGGVLDGDPVLSVRLGYRLNDNLIIELASGEATGSFSTTQTHYVSVLSQPFPDWRWFSPYLSLGIGKYRNTPKATLVGAVETDSNMGTAALGFNTYLTPRLYVRGELRRHVAYIDENRTRSYDAWTLGVGIFLP
jgi:hypothetical protein